MIKHIHSNALYFLHLKNYRKSAKPFFSAGSALYLRKTIVISLYIQARIKDVYPDRYAPLIVFSLQAYVSFF